jgi:hypothetical protein
MCYDSWWLLETDQGSIKLHLYDGMNAEMIKSKLKESDCNSLESAKEIEPKHFYFD